MSVQTAEVEGSLAPSSSARKGLTLIVFAWSMEIVGVAGGVINSTYTTFGEELPNTLGGYLPAMPMIALAVAELGRVPLASVLYQKHKFMQGVAVLGLLALSYLAVENWTFGFERVVDLRLKTVNVAAHGLARAQGDLAALEQQREQNTTTSSQKRDEVRRGLAQREVSISELSAQLSKEAETHQQNLIQIREACRLIRERCIVPRSQGEDRRFESEVNRLNTEIIRQRQERDRLQSQLDDLVTKDAAGVSALDQKIAAATVTLNQARQAMRSAADGNQIYRLASSWYGIATSEVTVEQFAKARLVFATFSAIAVALAGSVAALVYYARIRTPGAPSFIGALVAKVVRARRAYYARKRKSIVREVVGPERIVYREGKEPAVVVEREVPRFIDRIVLIPRFGIRFPIHINSLIRRGEQNSDSGLAAAAGNVMPLTKKAI